MIERRSITSREQWLELRKPNIGASEVGALFNVHPYVTPLRLYAQHRGTEFVDEDNAAMRRGRWLEPAVAKAVSELRPEWNLSAPNEYLRDSELRLGATPDFYVVRGDPPNLDNPARFGILQTKTVAPSVYETQWGSGIEVPLWIILQASVEAMLADADFIVIAALLVDAHNMDVSIHEMPRNPAAEVKITQAVADFWRRVETGQEPEPDFARDADTIRAMWKRETEPPIEIDLSGDNRIPELLVERAALKSAEKMAHDRIESINTQLIYAMKDAAVVTGINGWRISYKTTHYKGYSVPASDRRILRIADQRETT